MPRVGAAWTGVGGGATGVGVVPGLSADAGAGSVAGCVTAGGATGTEGAFGGGGVTAALVVGVGRTTGVVARSDDPVSFTVATMPTNAMATAPMSIAARGAFFCAPLSLPRPSQFM